MKAQVAFSTKSNIPDAVDELRAQLGACAPRLLLYFASSTYDGELLARTMKDAYPQAEQLGCTTAGELVSGRMLKGSVVAMALDDRLLARVKVECVPDLQDARQSVPAALSRLGEHFGTPVRDMDPARYVGLVLVDGLSGAEERLMDALGNSTDVIFVGGSAGDDLRFQATQVFVNGRAVGRAAALALLEPRVAFDFVKTQSFRVLPATLKATRVDEATRTVLEFNHRPAAQAYADALGVTPQELPGRLMHHPLGLMVGTEPYVRSAQRVQGDAVVFYCQILEGMELSVLEGEDIVEGTAGVLQQQTAHAAAAVINFNCILRTLQLEQLRQTEAYGQLFARVPTVGFSTYGEEFIGHVNQTATMLVLRAPA